MKTTAKNIVSISTESSTPEHEKFLRDWKAQRDIRSTVRAKRKQAFLTKHGADSAKTVRDSKGSTKESFEYPAIEGETAADHAALSYCSAMERAEKLTGMNFITLLSGAYALGVQVGATPVAAEKVG